MQRCWRQHAWMGSTLSTGNALPLEYNNAGRRSSACSGAGVRMREWDQH
jgi:hypothetical protein